MKNQTYLYLVLLFFVCMISFSAVNAADDGASNLISADDNNELILEDTGGLALDSADDETTSKGETSTGSFTDLDKLINDEFKDNTTIYLSSNYTYNSDISTESNFIHGITINRDLTIDGNGITIDGSHKARIFMVDALNVTFKNINFINGNATGSDLDVHGGAIFNFGIDCVAENCNFINNTAEISGGRGGALCFVDANNCTFTQNNAYTGGAMYHGSANNCTFTQNTAKNGESMAIGSANNCTFITKTSDKEETAYEVSCDDNCRFLVERENASVLTDYHHSCDDILASKNKEQ